MAHHKSQLIARDLTAAILSLSFLVVSSCSLMEPTGSGRVYSTDDSKREEGAAPQDTSAYETFVPTGTYAQETEETTELSLSDIMGAYLCSTWYDAVEDNPTDISSISSDSVFALKGVFYFNRPLTVTFKAKLLKDGEEFLTKEVRLKNNVTAEADFSAGLEGLGTFGPGVYQVELLFDDSIVGITSKLRVN